MSRLEKKTMATLLTILVLVSVILYTAPVSALKPYALVNGIVTGTSEGDAEGSWRYKFNWYRGDGLDICIVEHTEEGVQQRRLETVWSNTGFWSDVGPFHHVARMTQTIRGEECTVYAFAWGDAETFEAAILPDTTENKELYEIGLDLPYWEVLDFIKGVIAKSEYVVYGETKHAYFSPFISSSHGA